MLKFKMVQGDFGQAMGKPRLITDKETGETLSIREWAERLQIPEGTLRCRINKYGPDGLRRTYLDRRRPHTNPLTQETLTLKEWSDRLDIGVGHFRNRIRSWGAHNPETYEPRLRERSESNTLSALSPERWAKRYLRQK